MGRLVRDPETRYSNGQNAFAVARYTLAVDRRGVKKEQGGNQPTADFINCIAFGKSGEFAEKYFRQGMRVLVSGRIQTGSYTNKDGKKVHTTDVVVDDQEFADSKNQSAGGGSYNGGNGGSYQQASRPAPSNSGDEGFMDIPEGVDDDGLPFN